MKVKTLRFKDTKEFVHILEGGMVGTSAIPDILAETASIDALKTYYETFHPNAEIDYDNLEVVEYDFFESGEVGADIRNKLSSPKNLICLLERFLNSDMTEGLKKDLIGYIEREMEQTKINVDYLADLL